MNLLVLDILEVDVFRPHVSVTFFKNSIVITCQSVSQKVLSLVEAAIVEYITWN